MRRVVNILFGLAVLVAFGALLPINHDKILLRWWSGWETHIPLMVLLLFAFLIGIMFAGLLFFTHWLITVIERREKEWMPKPLRKAHKTLRHGENVLKKGKETDAEEAFREALKHYPGFAEAHIALGRLYRIQDKKDDALKEFLIAAALKPENVQLKMDVARLSFEAGDAARTAKTLGEVVDIEPDHPEAVRLMPEALAQAARWDEAIESQRKLIKSLPKELKPAEEEALREYQTEYARSLAGVAPGKSAKILAGILRHAPAFLPAVMAAADMQIMKGKEKEAYGVLAEAFRSRPEPFLYERLANMGDDFFDHAQELAGEALQTYPRHHALRIAGAKTLLGRNLAKETLDEAGKISGEPGFERLLIEAAANMKLGKTDEAAKAVGKAIEVMNIDYKCSNCGYSHRRWLAQCAQCGKFNTMTTGPFD